MTDMHYDLLSILYYCYIRNDFNYVEEIKKYFHEHNVSRVIANLYFLSFEEMKEELMGEEVNVVEMFRKSTELFKKYFPNIEGIFSIEGCDYIKDETQLEELKNMGLQSILLVWNNKNKYGSGVNAAGGLTVKGQRFLQKAIDLGLCLDLSHMNKETFWDTIGLLKKMKAEGKHFKVIVSHSNSEALYNHKRNIDDEQIKALKEFDTVMGIVTYSYFMTNEDLTSEEYEKLYLEHIKHVVKILGIDCVGISTDDMTYDNYFFNHSINKIIFSYKDLKNKIKKLLQKEFNDEEIEKILNKNIEKIFR